MPKLSQRLGFDLANAFPREREHLTHFFKRMLAAVVKTEAHFDDSLFARRERPQH
jgi:hypothetical protein